MPVEINSTMRLYLCRTMQVTSLKHRPTIKASKCHLAKCSSLNLQCSHCDILWPMAFGLVGKFLGAVKWIFKYFPSRKFALYCPSEACDGAVFRLYCKTMQNDGAAAGIPL
uniref:Uncharacterized protein n=1 Tax=Anguilla anguilla TaxID=7936 RepID=A0A0E9W6T5_ANGAN